MSASGKPFGVTCRAMVGVGVADMTRCGRRGSRESREGRARGDVVIAGKYGTAGTPLGQKTAALRPASPLLGLFQGVIDVRSEKVFRCGECASCWGFG